MKFFNAFIALFLLGLMFFINQGAFVQFKVRQYQVKKEIKHRIKAGIPQQELDVIKVPLEWEKEKNKDFKWIEGHEFRYKGEMYDVVKSEQHEGETWYYCIKDEKEKALFVELDEMVARKIAHDKTNDDWATASFVSLVYLSPQNSIPLFFSTDSKGVNPYVFASMTWVNSPPTQPPKA